LKIRTMRQDAEAGTGAVWTTSIRDPRITLLGRILRWTHLDELPQLWNVLRGDMVLVGPRPERPEFTGKLARAIPGYLDRLAVLPGITGLAQVNLPADSDLESVRRKLVLDFEYVRRASFSLDLRIVLCTCFRVLGIRSRRLRRLCGLYRSPEELSLTALNLLDGSADTDATTTADLEATVETPQAILDTWVEKSSSRPSEEMEVAAVLRRHADDRASHERASDRMRPRPR
jgi:hypothetical protein